MTLLSKDQEKNILDTVVITKFEIFPRLTQQISETPNISQYKLKEISKYSSGKIYHAVKALKLMKLVENGNGLSLTELGKRFLKRYQEEKKLPEDLLREACMNVPLFKEVYEEHKSLTEPRELMSLFIGKLKGEFPTINPRLIGSAIRRYLIGLHGKKLRAGARTGSVTVYGGGKEGTVFVSYPMKRKSGIITNLSEIKQRLQLNDEQLHDWIQQLPEEQRKKTLLELLSQI